MKIRISLARHHASNVDCPRPEVVLRVRTRYGDYVDIRFIVDTAADLTAIPDQLAKQQGLSYSRVHPGTATGLVGSVGKFRDIIRVRIAAEDFDRPCDFTQAPSSALGGTSPTSPEPLPVLGRAGFLDEYAICIDSGYMTITRLGPVRKWWRRLCRRLSFRMGTVHPIHQPL